MIKMEKTCYILKQLSCNIFNFGVADCANRHEEAKPNAYTITSLLLVPRAIVHLACKHVARLPCSVDM